MIRHPVYVTRMKCVIVLTLLGGVAVLGFLYSLQVFQLFLIFYSVF